MSNDKKPWRVAINGVEHERTFDNEEEANTFAASLRGNVGTTAAPNLTKKIATYVTDSARHRKAQKSGAAPPDEPKASAPPDEPKASAPPAKPKASAPPAKPDAGDPKASAPPAKPDEPTK